MVRHAIPLPALQVIVCNMHLRQTIRAVEKAGASTFNGAIEEVLIAYSRDSSLSEVHVGLVR